jgi:hypothetical protein
LCQRSKKGERSRNKDKVAIAEIENKNEELLELKAMLQRKYVWPMRPRPVHQ